MLKENNLWISNLKNLQALEIDEFYQNLNLKLEIFLWIYTQLLKKTQNNN